MIEAHRQVRSASHYVILFVTTSLLPFITVPVFTRILTPENYGMLALAGILGGFVSGLANLGMSVAFDRNIFQYAGQRDHISELLYSSLAFVFTNFVILIAVIAIFRGDITYLLMKSRDARILVIVVTTDRFFSLILNSFCLGYLRNQEKSGKYVRYALVFAALNFFVALLLVVVVRIGAVGIPLADLVASTLVSAAILIREGPRPIRFSFRTLRESLRIAYPLTPRVFVSTLSNQSDKYLLSLFQSIGSVGTYDIGRRASEMVFSFATALQNVFLPQLYKRLFSTDPEARGSIPRFIVPYLYVCLLAAIVMSMFSDEVIRVLTPPSYYSAIPVASILATSFGILFFSKITSVQLIFAKKTYLTSVITILEVTLNLGLDIPLIKAFGGIGAAMGLATTYVISTLVSQIFAQKYAPINWNIRELIPMLILLISAPTSMLVLRALGIPYWITLIVKLIILGLYALVGRQLGVLTRQNISAFRALLPWYRLPDMQ